MDEHTGGSGKETEIINEECAMLLLTAHNITKIATSNWQLLQYSFWPRSPLVNRHFLVNDSGDLSLSFSLFIWLCKNILMEDPHRLLHTNRKQIFQLQRNKTEWACP